MRCFGRFILVPLLCALPVVAAADTHPFSAADLVRFNRVDEPAASPDGKQVAFVVRETDMKADKGRKDIWIVDTGGGEPRRLTTHEADDSSPRWAAGGALYFLSDRSGKKQVWRLMPEGGEPEPVTDLPFDVGSFALSPDARHLAFSMGIFIDCTDLACTAERLKARKQSQVSALSFDELFIRHWDTWMDGRRSALFALPLHENGRATGEPISLSGSLDADVPSKPFGDAQDFTFTRDGRRVIFAARVADRGESWSTNFDLFRVSATGGKPENLTPGNDAWDATPVISPDGKWLAYRAQRRAGFEADRFGIRLRNLATGETREIAADWDRSVGKLAFAEDGRALIVTAADLGQTALWQIDLEDGEPRKLAGDGDIGALTIAGPDIVFTRDDLDSPADLYRIGLNGRGVTQLTRMNKERLANVRMGEYEQFSFEGVNGERVYGYVVQPADFEPEKKYPVAFLIHGGPQGSFGNHFHYRWNPQTYAGAGYAAVMIDFHGSTGYGQAFTDSISGDWGGKPFVDLQNGLAAALEKYEWLDGERVCALGGSYGGYMVNWIAGRWPERFRCLVNHDGIFDTRSFYYATEELWFPEWEFGGPHFENPKGYEEHNPVDYVKNWQTPMLVIHGEDDYRVPYTQGIAAFTALQRQSIPSEFIYFPDENHWVLKPHNSIYWHARVNAWLDRWLK